jgi:hypothetical protein
MDKPAVTPDRVASPCNYNGDTIKPLKKLRNKRERIKETAMQHGKVST